MPQEMFVANATRQHQIFTFRLPETLQSRQLPIPIGTQIRIRDLSAKDVEAIIRQNDAYGLTELSFALASKKFVPMCYSLDKPIPAVKIQVLSDRNVDALDDRGRTMREDAAIVMATQIGKQMKERDLGTELDAVEVEVTEDDDVRSRDRRAATGGDRIKETVVAALAGREGVVRERNKGRGRGR